MQTNDSILARLNADRSAWFAALQPGDAVAVGAFGRDYPGVVAKRGRTKVHVTFTTGTGVERTKAVDVDGISRADGDAALEALLALRVLDQSILDQERGIFVVSFKSGRHNHVRKVSAEQFAAHVLEDRAAAEKAVAAWEATQPKAEPVEEPVRASERVRSERDEVRARLALEAKKPLEDRAVGTREIPARTVLEAVLGYLAERAPKGRPAIEVDAVELCHAVLWADDEDEIRSARLITSTIGEIISSYADPLNGATIEHIRFRDGANGIARISVFLYKPAPAQKAARTLLAARDELRERIAEAESELRRVLGHNRADRLKAQIERLRGALAEAERAEAERHEKAKRESEDRSDTDGALSQWASGKLAGRATLAAEIAENGGRARFVGLWEGDRRVAAELREGQWDSYWHLRSDEAARFRRAFVPTGRKSRIQKENGLSERIELAPAEAVLASSGTGLGGSVWTAAERTGDRWGLDATLLDPEA